MTRWRFYEVYGHWLWAAFLVASVVILVAAFIYGCGGEARAAQTAKARSCLEDGDAVIQRSKTCPEAVAGLRRLVQESPDCGAIFGDKGAVQLVCEAPR